MYIYSALYYCYEARINCRLLVLRCINIIVTTVCQLIPIPQLVEAVAAPTHVWSCLLEVQEYNSPEQTRSTLASIPPG